MVVVDYGAEIWEKVGSAGKSMAQVWDPVPGLMQRLQQLPIRVFMKVQAR